MGLRAAIEGFKNYIGPKRFYQLLYHLVYSSNCWPDSTFNHGYYPVDPEVLADIDGRIQPYQIQMYLEAIRTAGDPAAILTGKHLLEASCGRGGGVSFLNRAFSPAAAVGLDTSSAAIRRAAARDPGCRWVCAPIQNMPFEPLSFDVLLSVDALHHYRWDCIDEVRRVLRPGGLCIVADSLAGSAEHAEASLLPWWQRLGFEPLAFRDITDSLAKACVADSPRRQALVNRSAFFMRKIMLEFAAAEGTDRYREFADHHRTFFVAVGRKPA